MEKEDDSEGDSEEGVWFAGPAFLMPRFNTLSALAQKQIEYGDIDAARQCYQRMLSLYDEISKSSITNADKQDAYKKLMDTFSVLSKPQEPAATGIVSAGKYLFPISLMVIVLLIILFAKPEYILTGLTALDSNRAPVWTGGEAEFTVSGRTDINLGKYFIDPDGDRITYLATDAHDINVEVSGSIVTITPSSMAKGVRAISIIASDLDKSTKIVAKLNII